MAGKRYKKVPWKEKLKNFTINTFLFVIMQILVGLAFTVPMIYYGPLENIRDMLVTTAMGTFKHQYIATWFLSDDKVSSIMEKYKVHDENKKSDESAISVFAPIDEETEKVEENPVEYIDISNDSIKGHILLIKDPSMVSLAITDKLGVKGMKLLDMVTRDGAIGGINAGGFGDAEGHGSGGVPTGLIMKDGQVLYGKEGEKYQVIGFNEDSVMVLGNYTLEEAREKRVKDAVSFGPYLIVNGEPLIKGKNTGGWALHPRTAIGQRKDGTVIMLVIDGRQLGSIGATLLDLQDIMLKYGAYNAANLDGGSSTTMVYDGSIVNHPSSTAGPRYLPSAFIIKPKE